MNEEINPCKKMLLKNILRILSMKNKVTPAKVCRKNIHPHVKERRQNSFMKTPTSNELKTYTSATKLRKYQNKAVF